ncbi:MAG: FHA domain-containing protein [Candidatus Manganitrophus sp.]|nr:MAG: FHA domain-containing protein [Candidatus Manganitrophus sp.]
MEGDDKGKRFLLSKPVIRIGRKEVELVLRDPEVSRQQCVIQIYGETAILRDLKSANGTLVNGFMVQEEVLKNNDQIRAGNTLFSDFPPTEEVKEIIEGNRFPIEAEFRPPPP